MSQEESQKGEKLSQLDIGQLTTEQLGELVKKAIDEGKDEAKFILVLSEWRRPGPSFTDEAEFTVLYGEVETILLHHYYDYPTTDDYMYALIPKTRTVVVLFKWKNDYKGKLEKQAVLYIFTYHKGWVSIDLY